MKQTLNGKWTLVPDPYKIGEEKKWYEASIFKAVKDNGFETTVPSNWNSHQSLDRYEGVCWYFREIKISPSSVDDDQIARFRFGGANYVSKVYLDGEFLGENEGGFLPFVIPIPKRLLESQEKHFLAVSVDNSRMRHGIPSFNTDWYNYGGIHRDVSLEILSKSRIENIQVTARISAESAVWLKISLDLVNFGDYLAQQLLSMSTPSLNSRIYYLGDCSSKSKQLNKILIHEMEFQVDEIPELAVDNELQSQSGSDEEDQLMKKEKKRKAKKAGKSKSKTDESGEMDGSDDMMDLQFDIGSEMDEEDHGEYPAKFRINFMEDIQNPIFWDLDNPALYEIELFLNGTQDVFRTTFGIRGIKTEGTNIYLNGKPIKLRGVALHEEQVPYGRTYPEEMRRKEILHIKELGFNTIRSSHYSHDEVMLKIADEEGILIFEEIPLYWDCTFGDRHTQVLGLKMLKTLIQRDYNHPSVIVWSIGNEIPVEQPACVALVRNYLKFVKNMDPTRLVTYVTARFWNDTLRKETDILCQNEYIGWYYGRLSMLNMILESLYPIAPDKPWFISEFGAGADYYADEKTRGDKFSMEYQYYFLKKSIETFNAKPWIAGWSIWIYRDFRSPLRQNKYQRGFNRKGIVTEDNKDKLFAKHSLAIINNVGKNVKTHPILGRALYATLKHISGFVNDVGQRLLNLGFKRKIRKYYTNQPEKSA